MPPSPMRAVNPCGQDAVLDVPGENRPEITGGTDPMNGPEKGMPGRFRGKLRLSRAYPSSFRSSGAG